MAEPVSFKDALDMNGLRQTDLAELGGWSKAAVNRWCRQRESDGRPPPRAAWALVFAHGFLSPHQQRVLRDELAAVVTDPEG